MRGSQNLRGRSFWGSSDFGRHNVKHMCPVPQLHAFSVPLLCCYGLEPPREDSEWVVSLSLLSHMVIPPGAPVLYRARQGHAELAGSKVRLARQDVRGGRGIWVLLTLLGGVLIVDDPGQAEVADFAAQGLRHQDVGRSQVPVD